MIDDYHLSVWLFGLSSLLGLLPDLVSGRWRLWRTWEGVRKEAARVRTPFEKSLRLACLTLAIAGLYVALR
jgi:hypothetical protein